VALDADGAAAIAFDIPALAVLGGDYDLVISAGDLRVADRTLRFSVVSESTATGVVDLGGAWRPLTAVEAST